MMRRMMNTFVSFHGVRNELRFYLPAFIEPQQVPTYVCTLIPSDPVNSHQTQSSIRSVLHNPLILSQLPSRVTLLRFPL
jgi:hypothetical protein